MLVPKKKKKKKKGRLAVTISSSFKLSYSNSHDHLNRQVQNAECAEILVNNKPKRAAFLNLLRSPTLPKKGLSLKQLLR